MNTKKILGAFLTAVFVLGTFALNAQTKIYVYKIDKSVVEFNVAELDSISFTPPPSIDYSGLKLNEISGAGTDSEKFYEFINIGDEPIDMTGCTMYYNNNGAPGDGNLTWTGGRCDVTHIIQPGELLVLMGRSDNSCAASPGSFTTGLTANGNIKITLRAPNGDLIDMFERTDFTVNGSGESFSRIPDGTGSFYYTLPTTPGVMNGTDTTGKSLVQ